LAQTFVSVLIDAFNHERFVEQAIISVLEQDFPASDREVIVVDDGSTDHTTEIVKKFEPQVRLLRKSNGGQASAFNAGIPECKGEIVAFLDGDDWWKKNKLSIVMAAFESHGNIGTVGHGILEVDETGKQLATVTPQKVYESHLGDVQQGQDFLPLRAFLGTSRLAIKADVLRRVGRLPEELVIEADEFLATVATALGGALVLEQPLTNYRYHSANLFQFTEWNPAKTSRKYGALACILRELPARLEKAGIKPEVIRTLTDGMRIDTERTRLSLGLGWPWETVKIEREAHRQAYRGASFGYYFFHAAVLGVAAILPPSTFYRLRHWYAIRGLRRARNVVGSAYLAPSLTVRTVQAPEAIEER